MSGNYLYRYTSWKRAKGVIRDSKLYFYSPLQVDDPFDCKISFDSATVTESERNDFAEIVAWRSNISIEDAKARCSDDDFIRRGALDLLNALEKTNCDVGFRFVSLSETYDDILMWSRYGDNHRGVVLQFDRSGLSSHFAQHCYRVTYHDTFPPLSQLNFAINRCRSGSSIELAQLLLCWKSRHWASQREWRVLGMGESERPFPPDILKGVITGCLIDPFDMSCLGDWAQRNRAFLRIYKAEKHPSAYALRFDPPLYDCN